MDRLKKEIQIYQNIVNNLKESTGSKELSKLSEELGISEKSLFRYLEAASEYINLKDILWNGKPLTIRVVKEYNYKNKTVFPKELSKSARLAKLIYLLNNTTPHGGMTLEEMAKKLGVSERTVFRDLTHLEQEMQVVIIRPEREAGKKGKYRMENTYLPPLSPDKALFIYLSLLQQKDTALTMEIREIKQALIGTLTRNRFNLKDIPLDKLESRIHIVDHTLIETEKVSETFLKIIRALEQSRVIKISYFKAASQTVSDRIVQPYGLICKHHNWYLVGRCLEKLELRTFRIDQIESVFVRSETFNYPSDFDLKSYYEDSWGVFLDEEVLDVKVLFSPAVAHRLGKIKYHPSQEIVKELADGSVIIKFKITGLREFVSWLLQWRTDARVIEPESLGLKVKEAAFQIFSLYIG